MLNWMYIIMSTRFGPSNIYIVFHSQPLISVRYTYIQVLPRHGFGPGLVLLLNILTLIFLSRLYRSSELVKMMCSNRRLTFSSIKGKGPPGF